MFCAPPRQCRRGGTESLDRELLRESAGRRIGRGLNSVENLIANSIDRPQCSIRRSAGRRTDSRLGARSKFKTDEVLDQVLEEVDNIADPFAMYVPQAPLLLVVVLVAIPVENWRAFDKDYDEDCDEDSAS